MKIALSYLLILVQIYMFLMDFGHKWGRSRLHFWRTVCAFLLMTALVTSLRLTVLSGWSLGNFLLLTAGLMFIFVLIVSNINFFVEEYARSGSVKLVIKSVPKIVLEEFGGHTPSFYEELNSAHTHGDTHAEINFPPELYIALRSGIISSTQFKKDINGKKVDYLKVDYLERDFKDQGEVVTYLKSLGIDTEIIV